MPSDEAHVKTRPAASERRDRVGNSEQPVVLDELHARQGVTGHNVRYVLGFGLLAK